MQIVLENILLNVSLYNFFKINLKFWINVN